MRSIIALLFVSIPLFTIANDAPQLQVAGNVISWPVFNADTINVHRSDDSYLETLPGDTTVWIAAEPGDYYLVFTNSGLWTDWLRSEAFTVVDTVPLYFDAEDVEFRVFQIHENDGKLRWIKPPYDHRMNVHTIHGEYLTTIAENEQEWTPSETGYYYVVASTAEHWENWQRSAPVLVSIPEVTPDDGSTLQLRADGDVIRWNSIDNTRSVNIHDGSGGYLDSVPASENKWRPANSGQYYVVATNTGDWQDWIRSNTVNFELNDQPIESALTVENHAVLIAEVLDIFRGAIFGADILSLPNYSNPAYEDDRVFGSSGVYSDVCDNGGTGLFYGRFTGSFTQTARWDFLFDNCLDGTSLFSGNFQRRSLSGIRRHGSTGLTVENHSGSIHYKGDIEYRLNTRGVVAQYYALTDVDYKSTQPEDAFELRQANVAIFYRPPDNRFLRGSFFLTSEITKGQMLTVAILKGFSNNTDTPFSDSQGTRRNYTSGDLLIYSDTGDSIRLNADNGDTASVDITIDSGANITSLTQPWSLWEDNLDFQFDLAGRI